MEQDELMQQLQALAGLMGDPRPRGTVHAAISAIAVLWHALDLVRQHPEFDEGGPMAEMMDQVLAGQPAPMLNALADIQRKYGPDDEAKRLP